MKILSYNILESGEGRIDPLAEAIRQAAPHIALLQETWDRPLALKLANRLGMELFLAENPRNPEGAIALLSSLPILEAVNHAPLDSRFTRGCFHALIQTPLGNTLPVFAVHLHARETLADEAIRLAELPALLAAAAPFAAVPHLLAGDFNAHSPAQIIDLSRLRPATQKRIAPQNNQIPRKLITQILSAGYMDTHALFRQPSEFQCSFSTSHPAARVDFIFANPLLAPHVKSSDVFSPPIGRFASDHYPIVAELSY